MTLVLNEIHLLEGLSNTLLVAAADRRISEPDGSYSVCQKLFPIPYLNGAVSYFGLAEVRPKGQRQYMSSWLRDFIRHHSSAPSLQSFAEDLREELNRIVPSSFLRQYPSGFHICGYNSAGYPDFWYFSNIGGMQGFCYVDLRDHYAPPGSHFLGRDATRVYGWDGKNPLSAKSNVVHIYRNGDFRAHVAAWDRLDDIFTDLLQFPDFRRPVAATGQKEWVERWVKFKFEVVAYFYRKWAEKEIISRPIDVLVLENVPVSR